MAKYFKEKQNTTAKEKSYSAKSREYQKTGLLGDTLSDRTNSWLKSTADYFGISTDKDEYTTDYFSRRGSRATELRKAGQSLWKEIESSSEFDDKTKKKLKSYFDAADTDFGKYESHYGQNPFAVKHSSKSIEDINEISKILLSDSGRTGATELVGLRGVTTPDFANFMPTETAKELNTLFDIKSYKTITEGNLPLIPTEEDLKQHDIQRAAAGYTGDSPYYYKEQDKNDIGPLASFAKNDKVSLPGGMKAFDTEKSKSELDVDKSGKINIKDATKLQKDNTYLPARYSLTQNPDFKEKSGKIEFSDEVWDKKNQAMPDEVVDDTTPSNIFVESKLSYKAWDTKNKLAFIQDPRREKLFNLYVDQASGRADGQQEGKWYNTFDSNAILPDDFDYTAYALQYQDVPLTYINGQEAAIARYIYNTEGEKAFNDYIDALTPILNSRRTERIKVDANRLANETGFMGSVLLSAASMAPQLVSGTGVFEDVYKVVARKDIDVNSNAHLNAQYANAYRGAVSGELDEKYGELASNAYGVGMSIADFAYATLVSKGIGSSMNMSAKGVERLALNLQSSSAATNTIIDAKNSGLKDEEAISLGVVAYAAEYLTEKISWETLFNNGGKSLVRYIAENVATEGAEEVISQGVNDFAEFVIRKGKNHYTDLYNQFIEEGMSDTEAEKAMWGSAIKEYTTVAIGGMASGGVLGGAYAGINKIASSSSGKNLTDTEEKVVNKLYEDALAEMEKDGTKLNKAERDKLWDSIVEDMSKGQLKIDDIESVLGGDTYKAYTDTAKKNAALKAELDKLSNMRKGDMTRVQEKRLEELEAMNLDDTTEISQLKHQLSHEVLDIVRSDKTGRLAESYKEVARRRETFKADLTKYKGKQREAVKRAMDSGVLNNTYRSHELVNILSKIEADKGIVFNYADNAKLKESGFALNGKTVNGFVDNKTGAITLNIQSAKSWQSAVGHEITHVLEGTEAYSELQNALYAYAESKGELSDRRGAITELYKGMNADVDAELTADLVGDYLFSDKEFVTHLTTNRNLFQKIYDEIKYLYKVATGKEQKEIAKVKKEFDKAWKELNANPAESEQKNNTADKSGVKYSLSSQSQSQISANMTDTQRSEVLKSKNIVAPVYEGEADVSIENESDLASGRSKLVKSALIRIAEEFNVFTDYDVKDVDLRISLSKSNLKESVQKASEPKQLAKLMPILKETVENAIGIESHKNRYYYDNATVSFDNLLGGYIDGEYFVPVRFGLKHIMGGKTVLYVVVDQQKIKAEVLKTTPQPKVGSTVSRSAYNYNLSQVIPFVNSKDLLRYLPDDMLSAEQKKIKQEGIAETIKYTNDKNDAKYAKFIADGNMQAAQDMVDAAAEIAMKDSKIRDERGKLVKVYHGSDSADFYEFDKQRRGQTDSSMYGRGYYFAFDSDYASDFGENIREFYVDIKNPYYIDVNAPASKIANFLESKGVKVDFDYSNMKSHYFAKNFGSQKFADTLVDLGFDGVIVRTDEGNYFEAVAFHRNQMKLADAVTYDNDGNVIPISERFNEEKKDIRYSLSNEADDIAPAGNFNTPLNELYYDDIAPIRKDISLVKATNDTDDGGKKTASKNDDIAPVVANNAITAPIKEDIAPVIEQKETEKLTRSTLHSNIVDNFKSEFSRKGFDFDKVLNKAKNLSTFSTVDNTPQRVMEKALGYKEGQVLADLTVNKVAKNETEGIKWLNSFTDRKNGLLAQISKQYGIKPGSKESAAAQMYAEGFYVNKVNEIVKYGDAELSKDFPDIKVRDNIKGLAGDPRIRRIYDETLKAINESRTRNAYPEIQRLDNYFLHFRAMGDTFSRLGLPFNPNDIRAKDLPTDLNGVTADLKPGKPFFASEMHRTGKRTSFDLLGGLERYLTSAKNQIYHIDDIQNLRALRNYIADSYGQANGLEGLDALSEEEVQERIKQVYDSHLSTFAKFLNEEANVLAGKTDMLDRAVESKLGRRAITFLDTVNKQIGSNMVGFNISSSLTNFLPVAQSFAKTNKFDFTKAFAQTVSNKIKSLYGKGDSFSEDSPVIIRRKGAERFYRTPYQKVGDAGYVLMSAVDNISTELIARTKYNELTRKGMDGQQAHFETDKWVSRLMGDRSLGQQPQLYNSKMLGIFTKFQLEVRNQLDSMFYDTIQEAKVSNEHIENVLARNAKTAAKVTSTFVQLAVVQHLFGIAFEAVAGYNPAFDIISVLATVFGFDDDEESEDTVLDNVEQGFFELLEDLPYTSTFTGGRVPISSALPIKQLVTGTDEYGNDKPRWETALEAAPYYALPTGYGQIKKTKAGLEMFSDKHPIAGSYTDKGNLRFPVEDTPINRIQAGLFGQYANENAREYFDNELAPLKAEQIPKYMASGIPYMEYRKYQKEINAFEADKDENGESISGSKKEKVIDYIHNLDIDYGSKLVLIKSKYPAEDAYNEEIVNYINNREDLSYEDRVAIFTELGFKVAEDTVYWD